jgi:parvulin-like peptidyl-prolyl isomerase
MAAKPAVSPVDKVMGHSDAASIVVARVNGVKINMAQLMDRIYDLTMERYGRREITPFLAQKIKDESLKQLIMEELAYQKAAKSIKVSAAEVKKVTKAQIKAMGGDKGLQRYLRANGMKNRAAFAEQIRRMLTVRGYIRKNIDPKIKITADDLKAAYAQGQAYFHAPANVQVNKILFFGDPNDPRTIRQILKVRSEIIKKYNNHPEKLKANGTFVVQENIHLNKTVDKELYKAAKKLGRYEISKPIKMNGNFYLVQLTGYKPAQNKSFKMVKTYLKNQLMSRKKRALLAAWRKQLPKGAKIEFVDLKP